MTRRPKLPKPRKISRNPLARELGGPKYRSRVVKKAGTYKRRPKHPTPPEEPI